MQVNGSSREEIHNGSNLQGYEIASKMSQKSHKNSAKDSRSPQMTSKLLYTQEQNGFNDTHNSALRNFKASNCQNTQ